MKKLFLIVQRDLVMMLNMTVYTSLVRAVDCLVFFFSGPFQQCSILKQHENKHFSSLVLGVQIGMHFTLDF